MYTAMSAVCLVNGCALACFLLTTSWLQNSLDVALPSCSCELGAQRKRILNLFF